ncbi:[pyruvate dehydrogenase (acetyl-transferring)]-phosphatase [Trifolium repens]|nr:[pyruvate dehydrogenase (acetyl-transferring)]-phosphatase [Trifolium repens]
MAAVKANMDMEDQSQVEVGTDALFVGVYDGHKGDTTAIYLRDHIFREILGRIQQNIKHMDNRVVDYSETVLRQGEIFRRIPQTTNDPKYFIVLAGTIEENSAE